MAGVALEAFLFQPQSADGEDENCGMDIAALKSLITGAKSQHDRPE